MGKPTPHSHTSLLSSKLLDMISDASHSLLDKEAAQAEDCLEDGEPPRKRKRVEGGIGGGMLAELANDLDPEDERAKALVVALVRHIRLKRRPPPPAPSLLVRPPSHSHSHSHFHPNRTHSSHTHTTREALNLHTRNPVLLSSSSATFRSSPSASRYHIQLSSTPLSPPSLPLTRSPSPSFSLPPPPPELRSLDDSGNAHPRQPAMPDSPPWQPAEELHIAPEALARFRAFREDYVRRAGGGGGGGREEAEGEIRAMGGFGLDEEGGFGGFGEVGVDLLEMAEENSEEEGDWIP